MIPESFKQELLNRVDIVDVIGRYVQLKKAGANYLGLCPFHNEKTPSFSVSPSKQFYHCFGCQKGGNAIGFLMDYGSLGYVDALKELAATVGMQVPEWQPRTPEEAKRKERETDLHAILQKAMEFYRAELKRKCDVLMDCFPSQATRAWFSRDTFEAIARLRGIECNAPEGFAEAFYGRKLCVAY